MVHPDALSIAFELEEQTKEIIQLLCIGTRIDGSLVLLHTGMSHEEIQKLCADCRTWLGDKLSHELQR